MAAMRGFGLRVPGVLRRLPNVVLVALIAASCVAYIRWRPVLSGRPGPLVAGAPSLTLIGTSIPALKLVKLDQPLRAGAGYHGSLDDAVHDLAQRIGMPVVVEWDRIGKEMKQNRQGAKELVRVNASVTGRPAVDAIRILLSSAGPGDLQLDFGLITFAPAARLSDLSGDTREREVDPSLPWQLLISTRLGIDEHGWTQVYEVGDLLKSSPASALLAKLNATTGRGGHLHRIGFAGSTLIVTESPRNQGLIAAELARLRWEVRVADWHRQMRSLCLETAIATGGMVGAAVLLWLVVLRKPARGPSGCESCGYDLTGNVSGVCPECGAAVVRAI